MGHVWGKQNGFQLGFEQLRMPRSKGLFKAITATKQHDNKSANEDLGQCSSVRMKDVEQTAAAAAVKEEEDETISKADVSSTGDTSVESSARHEKENEADSVPNKPRRLFMITGCKKKDAKRGKSKETDADMVQEEPQACEADTTSQQIADTDSLNDVQVVAKAAKRNSRGDEHPYEDPSLLLNNSSTPRVEDNKNNSSKPKAKKTSRKKMKEEQAPQSPGLNKSTESIKAAVKAVSEGPSVMSEHSVARSTFAFLVALLLSLIMFLAFYFLLQSHPVLAVVLAILIYSVVSLILGFLDGTRLKCLLLLFLPSVCSEGGKLALYIVLLFFAIKGPLCDTIGNIKSVRGSIQCVNNQHSGELEAMTKAFHAAQYCTRNYPQNSTKSKSNQSMEASLGCLKKSCLVVKEKFKRECAMERPRISPKLCSLARGLSCNNSRFLKNLESCPKSDQTPCQKELDKILGFFGEEEEDCCGFLEIVAMLLPLLILVLFHEAYNYEKNYRTYNDFHNYFLTGYFQCIDQSRSSCDREAVLPLRKVELRKHVRPAVCHLSESEKTTLYGSLKTYLLFLLLVLFVILADYYTFTMFNIKSDKEPDVSNFPHFENKSLIQKMAENVSSIGGNRTNNLTAAGNLFQLPDMTDNNEDVCLVTVESVGSISKVVIPILLSILLIVILLQAYIMRLQWRICSRFYNEREKERVFYLYNKILEDRILLVEKCRKQMKCYNREIKTLKSMEPTRILAQQAKWLSKVFKFSRINLRKCIICNDSEKSSFKFCHGTDCLGAYCLECSFDIDKKCLYCDTELKGSLSVQQADDEQVLCSKESLV